MKLSDPLSIELINRYQGGVPLCENPYAELAADLGSDETTILKQLENLLAQGWLTRFGPLYDAKKMGGGLTLAAISVEESQFEKVTEIVNSFDQVAHNYRRSHKLNMWFVVATETEQEILSVLDDIEQQTGLKVYNCPKLQEFYVGLKLFIDERGAVDSVPMDVAWLSRPDEADRQAELSELQRKIVAVTQTGLPLHIRPYEQIAQQIDCDSETVIKSLQTMLEQGSLRRIGVVPNHYKLGLHGNGMTVWDVPDELISEVGPKVGAMEFVSHCYQRPRHMPNWPYNLFAMVHGSDRAQVLKKLDIMKQELFPYNFRHEVLFSTAILKKSGLRLVA